MTDRGNEFEFVVELSRIAASARVLQPLLEWIVQKTTILLGADDGSIKLMDEGNVLESRVRSQGGGSWPRGITESVGGYLARTLQALATPDVIGDSRFSGLKRTESRVRAVLAVPLQVEDRLIGMLAVSQRTPGREWTRQETELLEVAAAHSAEVIERVNIRGRLDQYQRDMVLAGDLQSALVPRAPLRCGPWEVAGCVVPARHVGGDYFDYFPIGQGRFAVAVADVSGKGFPAALLVAKFSTLVRTYCDGRRPVAEAFHHMNRSLIEQAPPGNAITSFFAEVDHRRGLMRFVRAGHSYPLLRHADGAVEAMREGDVPLGAFEDATYTESECPFVPSDALLLYTDGVTEAMNGKDEFFGEERLAGVWRECEDRTPADVVRCVLSEVQRFRSGAEPSDDIAVVAVGRAGGS